MRFLWGPPLSCLPPGGTGDVVLAPPGLPEPPGSLPVALADPMVVGVGSVRAQVSLGAQVRVLRLPGKPARQAPRSWSVPPIPPV